MPVLSFACHLPHNTPNIPSRYNNEQTTKQTKAINNSYIYIYISCKCDTNRAGHFTLDAYASRPVACQIMFYSYVDPELKTAHGFSKTICVPCENATPEARELYSAELGWCPEMPAGSCDPGYYHVSTLGISKIPISIYMLNHTVHTWQISPQLSCGDTCQI